MIQKRRSGMEWTLKNGFDTISGNQKKKRGEVTVLIVTGYKKGGKQTLNM